MRANDVIQSEDVNPDEVRKYIVFHDRLNPKYWEDYNTLRPLVRLLLLKNAMEFFRFLDLPNLKIQDVILTGSNASYNYTALSDLDVHIIVDFHKAPCPGLMENFFNAKKTLWNTLHDVTIKGQTVEMYVQDADGLLEANGVFSLLKNEWVVAPKRQKPSWNDKAVVAKTDQFANEIDTLLSAKPTEDQITELLDRIKTMRRSGLAAGGEFATENLTFKSLRNLGYLDRLFKARNKLQDDHLSSR